MHSSTSIAMRLRNSIVVGFIRTSPSEMVGNSSGKPPARPHAALHRLRHLAQVRVAVGQLRPGVGDADHRAGRRRPASLKPSAFSHERCTKPSRSLRPNQLRLRSAWDVMAPSETEKLTDNQPRATVAPPERRADVYEHPPEVAHITRRLHAAGRQGRGRDGRRAAGSGAASCWRWRARAPTSRSPTSRC